MEEAYWIAVERSFPTGHRWSGWLHVLPSPAERPCGMWSICLVATFACPSELDRAVWAFREASFNTADVVVILPAAASNPSAIWPRVCDWARRALGGAVRPPLRISAGPERLAFSIQELLRSGGGLVFVNPGTRIHEACQIIRRSGGHIGIWPLWQAQAVAAGRI